METILATALRQVMDGMMYLCGCWSRVSTLLANEPTAESCKPRREFLKELQTLITNYVILALTEDDIIPATVSPLQQVVSMLVSDIRPSWVPQDAPQDFFTQLLQRADQNSEKIVSSLVQQIGRQLNHLTLVDTFTPYFRVLERLTQGNLASLCVKSPQWLLKNSRKTNGRHVQRNSLLGPMFGLSVQGARARAALFELEDGLLKPNAKWTENSLHTVREGWTMAVRMAHSIVKENFLPKGTREQMIEWFAFALNSNADRSKMRHNPNEVSSTTFVVTLCDVLLELTMPIINKDAAMRKNLHPCYVTSAQADINYENVTRLAADSDTVKRVTQEREKDHPQFGFITQCFFFAFQALSLGPMSSLSHKDETRHQISHLKKQIKKLEATKPQWERTGEAYAKMSELQQTKAYLSMVLLQELEIDAYMLTKDFAIRLLTFLDYAAMWLLRVAFQDPNAETFDANRKLAEHPPDEWKVLPEYMMSSISDCMVYYLRLVLWGQSREITPNDFHMKYIPKLLALFMGCSPEWIQNPYTRSNIPQIFHFVSILDREMGKRGMHCEMSGMFMDPILREHLLGGCMVLYVDLENLGGHNQFYDKFEPRNYIAELIQHLWKTYPEYQVAFAKEAENAEATGQTRFVKFFNFLLNDCTFLLDESIQALKEIKELGQALRSGVPESERGDKEDGLRQAEGRCQSYLGLGNACVDLMLTISKDMPAPFVKEELVNQLAQMLDFFLDILCNKRKDLNVTDAEQKYGFKHRELIGKIVTTYIHFKSFKQFTQAVAQDGRSYSKAGFKSALDVVKQFAPLMPGEVQVFAEMCKEFEECADQEAADDEMWEDYPDEFEDPLSYAILNVPMKLPSSGQIVERAIITRALLNDEIDPFNRSKLTTEELLAYNEKPEVKAEMDELAKKINAWKEEQKKNKT
eukprot:TRINITY_DN38540_c0_g1_i1.p1 TRINITY_DN38540_c0_g1~~TRINITY_DN38540_c0_g1_i1.p1  ORF type:complete len:1031 (+),score=95.07 TRINITY_DN38540_c0_g1_i1:331-3093(+)